MAKIIKGDININQRSKYPWDDWLNGKQWELTAGSDYTNFHNIRCAAYIQGRIRSLRISIRQVNDATVRLQAFPKEETV